MSITSQLSAGSGEDAGSMQDLKQIEQAMRQSDEHFRTIANAAPLLIWLASTDKLCYFFNKGWLDFTGRSLEQEVGNGWAEGVHPDDFERCLEVYTQSFDARQPFEMEYRLRHHSGEHRWILDRGVPRFAQDGTFEGYLGNCTDVHQQKTTEAALRDTEAQTKAAMEAGAVGTWQWDMVQNIVTTNPTFARLFGLTAEQAEDGMPIEAYIAAIHPNDREPVEKQITAAIQSRSSYAVEYRVCDSTGAWRWVAARGAARYDEEGRPVSFPGALIDFTERKQAEVQIAAQNEVLDAVALGRPLEEIFELVTSSLERVIPGALASVLLANAEETQLFCGAGASLPAEYNAAVDGLFIAEGHGSCGTSASRRTPVHVSDIAHDPLWQQYRDFAAKHGLAACWSHPVLSPGGQLFGTIAIYFHAPRTATENETSLLASASRITGIAIGRKRSEESAQESKERFRGLADQMSQLAWMADAQGKVSWYNQRWYHFTGATPQKMKELGWEGVQHPAHAERVMKKWQSHLMSGEAWEDTFPMRGADARYRWFLSRAQPIRDAEGKIVRWFGTNTDITDQREVDAQIRSLLEDAQAARVSAEAAKERAESATRAKDDFLAQLSHELRTPLSPALLLSRELAEDETLSPSARADMETIARGIALQARLIDDMLDISRITTGKLRLDPHPMDAHDAMRLACDIILADANEHRLELSLHLDAEHHAIHADAVRVQQVFWNVLKNAVKFTPRGGSITVRTHNPVSPAGMIEVEVTDTGIGIEPDMLGRVFDAFAQGDHGFRFGGLGLGLAISQRLVELHHGNISVTSDGRDQGATFRIQLPLAVPTSDTPPAPRLESPMLKPSKPRRILLVEDHETTRATLARLLKRRGHQIVEAGTLAAAFEAAENHKFDLVISDLGLPDGDGHQLMSALSKSKGLIGIALSGYGMEDDLARSRASGFFTHLTKPVDFQALEAMIAAAPSR
ncbi:hybrid sensor histidine kinase/response regulator [Brevifollis gellanilyticus]|uniref:histidine kinase n=1 Tax=Brevifollis gellanilyticus TaxID=748831 RepID=A0A512MD74_9BACT|nr:PAS domain-containing protein [Brevifollis gellanilyticus]GEP44677.1 hypothetical protein BGE01nite_39680 [Brevifollis gellanilyticus]